MTILRDDSLSNFEFWCGAKSITKLLTLDELMIIEYWMEEVQEAWSETEINDFFWFEDEQIAEILGYEDADTMWDELLTRD